MSRTPGKVIDVRAAGGNHRVLSVDMDADGQGSFRRRPCDAHDDKPACPWRLDAQVGEYPPEAYRLSAPTAYDMATRGFGCHQSTAEKPQACAGFLLRGAADNLMIRMWIARGVDLSQVMSGVPLYASYRDMAIANGVDPDDPTIAPCRGGTVL